MREDGKADIVRSSTVEITLPWTTPAYISITIAPGKKPIANLNHNDVVAA